MALAWTGCGPTDDGLGAREAAATCVDADGDGFGTGCQFGIDCDDEDPEVTRCDGVDDDIVDDDDDTGKPDAECKKGDTRECKLDLGTTAGVHTCWIGTQICDQHGDWGPCLTDV